MKLAYCGEKRVITGVGLLQPQQVISVSEDTGKRLLEMGCFVEVKEEKKEEKTFKKRSRRR